jgi:NitT/TauT family transport system permease protein
MKRWERIVWPLLTAAGALAVWHVAVLLTDTRIFPGPIQVALALLELFRKGLIVRYTLDSLARVSAGYLAAVALGIPVGLVLGWYPLARRAFNPVIQMIRPISPIAWIPVAILWFGVGPLAPIFLIFLASSFPIVVATVNGVRNVPPMFLNAGQNFGLSTGAVLLRVVLPASLPQILIGLRIALGIAWLVVVAAEMIAVDSGLGYLIMDSRNAGKRYDLVIAGMLLIGLIGLALDTGVRRLERMRSIRWGFSSD